MALAGLLATLSAAWTGIAVHRVATQAGEAFGVVLSGATERPAPVSTNASGTASLSFDGSGPITYTVNVTGLTGPPTGAHLHGPADTAGTAGVLVALKPVAGATSGLLFSGTINSTGNASVSLDSLKALMRNGKAYVNVHTVANPSGEIRGQVARQ